MGRNQLLRLGQGTQQTGDAIVQVPQTGEVVKDPLVDAQRRHGEALPAVRLYQPPMAQRRGGKESAPVGAGERGQREAESGQPARRITLGGGTAGGEGGVQLRTGGEKEHVALEGGQAEAVDKDLQRGRRGHGCGGRRPRSLR